MTIWIARDWYSTMVFTTKPKLLPSYGSEKEKEWYGHREHYLESYIPKDIKNKIKMNECVECEITINIERKV